MQIDHSRQEAMKEHRCCTGSCRQTRPGQHKRPCRQTYTGTAHAFVDRHVQMQQKLLWAGQLLAHNRLLLNGGFRFCCVRLACEITEKTHFYGSLIFTPILIKNERRTLYGTACVLVPVCVHQASNWCRRCITLFLY
jgi:hypothetical protein